MFHSEKITDTLLKLTKLPGISKKTAERIIYWILESSEQDVNLLANSLKSLKYDVLYCKMCTAPLFNKQSCEICNSNDRENKLLIVESLQIMQKIEKAKFYKGKYFVFRKKLLSEYIIKKEQNLINELVEYSQNFDEIILGLSPNMDGEITKHVLKNFIEPVNQKITELAVGLPVGSSVDYIDELTLKLSLANRKKTIE